MPDKLKELTRSAFPPLLQEIPDAPKRLYVRGTLPPYDYHWLAVVGSRALSPYGIQSCEYLLEGLKGHPVVIVSGLAYGTDALAHKIALSIGLTCIGVPGSGLEWDVIYPRANLGLAREIVKSGGALLSEFDPHQKAADYTFPQRNRIMAGMSHATLMIEAKERSGTLITARLATEYNRDLLVVPGSIFSPQHKGIHQFLKLGATPVTEPGDILKALGIEETPTPVVHSDLSAEEAYVLEILTTTPLPRDALVEKLSLPISEANVLLSTMEIKGLITESMGLVRPL